MDYEVIDLLGQTLFERAKQIRDPAAKDERDQLLKQAVEQYQKVLKLDSENVSAHYGLMLLYQELGDKAKVAEHSKLHARYKPDDNARDVAFEKAKRKYPAAARASEALVIYSLNRPGAPGLSTAAKAPTSEGAKPGDD
jgi:hypothetical protein